MRKTLAAARRALREEEDAMLRVRWVYAMAFYKDAGATLADLRVAVNTLEETERIARRVLGSAHPTAECIEQALRESRAVLRERETLPG